MKPALRKVFALGIQGVFCKRYSSVPLHVGERNNKPLHVPVMAQQVVDFINPRKNEVILDMTFGAGGHSKLLLNAEPTCKLIAVDRDSVAIRLAMELAAEYPEQVIPIHARFSELPDLLHSHGYGPESIDAVLIDCGCSSMQFDDGSRGFSLSKEGPLDMRMDGDRFPEQPTAADVLRHADERSLARMLKVYGQEKKAKKIARALVELRFMLQTITTTSELAHFVNCVIGGEERFDRLGRPAHLATKTFQALRIFVNNELNELNCGMDVAHKFLKVKGKLAVLTFHSLEDTIVKRHLVGIDLDEPKGVNLNQKYKNAAVWHSKEAIDDLTAKKWLPVNKHVLTPDESELSQNPRSRSCKLRTALKLM